MSLLSQFLILQNTTVQQFTTSAHLPLQSRYLYVFIQGAGGGGGGAKLWFIYR